MAKTFLIQELRDEFIHRDLFSRQDLLCFFKRTDPDLNENTFRWRIHDLKEGKVITSVAKDQYSLAFKPPFVPQLSAMERRIDDLLKRDFKGLKSCVWSTDSLHELMLHQPGRSFTIVEVEADALLPAFNELKSGTGYDVFLQPEERELDYYVFEAKSPVILQRLVSKAPVQRVQKWTTTTLEKILVDLFCDKKLFRAYQGSELGKIVNTAYERYALNFTTLFSYANRRKKEKELKSFLTNETEIPQILLQ